MSKSSGTAPRNGVLLKAVHVSTPSTLSNDPSPSYYVQSERSKVFHSKSKCGSSTCHIVCNATTLPPHLRACKRCVQTNHNTDTETPESIAPHDSVFDCYDCESKTVCHVTVNLENAEIECDCEAFRDGELCRHLRFVLTRVMGSDRWLDTMYEYGGFEDADGKTFVHDLNLAITSIDSSKRRCFACLQYVNGLHTFHDKCSGRVYHKTCFACLSNYK